MVAEIVQFVQTPLNCYPRTRGAVGADEQRRYSYQA
jgi:hypothetical protein